MMRIHQELYDHLKKYPRRLILPHRLNPYPSQVIAIPSSPTIYIDPVVTIYQCLHKTLPYLHTLVTPYRHPISTYSINAPYQLTLSTHPINPPC